LYSSYPPSGRPIRAQLVEDYSLPFSFTFSGLPAGTYYVGALIDVDRMDTTWSGMLNPERDPYGYAGEGTPFEIVDFESVPSADIELEVQQ